MRKIAIILTLIFLFAALPLSAAEVKNTEVRQVGNRGQFTYDLLGDEPEEEVEVTLTIQGKEYKAADLHLEGDCGKVKTGRGRVIWWNILQDFPRGLDAGVKWRVEAGGKEFKDAATGMEFIRIKGGCFEMGDTFGDGDAEEKPVHSVCVNDFYLGKYEVTVGQFRKFVQDTDYKTEAEKGDGSFVWKGSKWEKERGMSWRSPGFSQDDNHPVVCISWNDAQAFKEWLSRKSGKSYRLPTEAEWEYAARSGGKSYKYSWGNGSPSGNIADKSLKKRFSDWTIWDGYDDGYVYTAPVGRFQPNNLGLYDMTGNVWEWCQDWYGKEYYAESPKDNPWGPASGQYRVLRGGAWISDPRYVRAANRDRGIPDYRSDSSGFRLSVSAP